MPTLFSISHRLFSQHGSYTSRVAETAGYRVMHFKSTFTGGKGRHDLSRGPFAIPDTCPVRDLPLIYDRRPGEREPLNIEHLRQTGFDWGAQPDVLVISQQAGVSPAIRTLFDPQPVTLLYAEYFTPSDIAARKEWPVHPSNYGAVQRVRRKSIADGTAADGIIVPTHYAKQCWPRAFQDKVHVIFDGVDAEHLSPARIRDLTDYGARLRASLPGKKLVGHIGRTLESIRGFDSWMKAYVELRRARPDLHFVIMGEAKTMQKGGGSEVYYGIPNFKDHVLDSLGLTEAEMTDVTWIPRLELDEFLSVVGALDLVIYPMFGMFGNWSLFQGMLQGVPMVASNRAYLPEVIQHGDNGFLADPEDVAGMVELSLQVLDSPELTRKFRENSAATMRGRYSVEQSARDFLKLMRELGVE